VNSIVIGGIVFACTFCGAVLGIWFRTLLPDHHLTNESKEVIKLGTGLIATMAALVVGLLIASAKSDFDAQKSAFQQMSTNIVLLDRALAHYGPETKDSRTLLRQSATTLLDRYWPSPDSSKHVDDDKLRTSAGAMYDSIRDLTPRNDAQRSIQSLALQTSADLARTRLQISQRELGSIPLPFLVVLAFWLTILFISFGLFAPTNLTVTGALFVCALSVAGALFLIVDLDQPYEGFIQVSPEPLRSSISQLGQ
jgi:hypothetical protein